jgi:hypothetical protein
LKTHIISLHKTNTSLNKQLLSKIKEIENLKLNFKRNNQNNNESKIDLIGDKDRNIINLNDSLEIEKPSEHSVDNSEEEDEENAEEKISIDLEKSKFKENHTYAEYYENSRNSFLNLDNSFNWSNRSLLSSKKNSNNNINFKNIYYKQSFNSILNRPRDKNLLNLRTPNKNENSQMENLINLNDSNPSSSGSRSPRRIDFGFLKNSMAKNAGVNGSFTTSSRVPSKPESPFKQSSNKLFLTGNSHSSVILGSKTKRKNNKLKSLEKKESGLTQLNIKDIFNKFKKIN